MIVNKTVYKIIRKKVVTLLLIKFRNFLLKLSFILTEILTAGIKQNGQRNSKTN
jgi:hypothetical protein